MTRRRTRALIVLGWAMLVLASACQAATPSTQPTTKPVAATTAAPAPATSAAKAVAPQPVTPPSPPAASPQGTMTRGPSAASPSLLTPTPNGTEMPASIPKAGVIGRIIFAKDGGLYTLEPATGAIYQLAGIPARTYIGAPAISLDGTQIAYSLYDLKRATEKRDNGTDLYLMTASGADPRLLIEHDSVGAWFSEPAWLPDGKSLLFTRRDARGKESIEKVSLANPQREVVIPDATSPSIAPDGKLVTYLVTDPQAYTQTLWVAALDGSNPKMLLGDPEFQALIIPRFSPDGQRIAFIAVGGPEMTPPRTAARRGWNPLAWLQPPSAEAHGIPYNIWTVKPDGTDLRRLTLDLEVELPTLVWSPDNKWIGFTSDRGMEIVSADGKEKHFLARDFAVGGLDWIAH